MNKIFKVVWSKTKECYVVVSEVAKNNGGKKKVLATVFAALVATGSMVPDYVDAANNTSGGGVSSADASIAIGSGWGNSAYANTNFSIAIGDQSNANGKAAIALGRQAKTNGEEAAIAIGNQTEATSKDSTAVGSGSKSSGEYAAALGFQTKATANYATAIGSGARGYAEDSQAIGREAETSAGAFRAIAIGTLSKSSANYATSLGSSAEASAERAIAVGYKSTAKAESAISVGNLANAGNTDSIAVGNGSAATANYAVAVGSGSAVSGLNGVAVGKNSQATGQSAAAFGDSAQATNAQATAIGNQAVASDTRTTAIGNQAKATGPNATVVGSVSEGTGPGATAIGTNNKAGYESAAVGLSNTVSGNTSAAFGRSNTVTGKESLAAGVRSTASGEHNVAIGYQAATDGKATVAIGESSKADIADGVAIGSNSATTAAAGVQGFNPADSRTNTYSGLTGTAQTSTLGAVAVGNGAIATRQITGLAAGKEDTDAVNVAQLRSVNLKYAGNSGDSDVRLENGTLNIKGEGLLSTSADGTGITVKLTKGDDIAKDNGKAKEPTNNGVATTQNVVQAINNSYWKATAGGNTDGTPAVGNVKPGTQVTYSAGDNLKVKQTIAANGDQEYKYSLNPVLTGITSIANTAGGPTMTFGGNSINITGGSLNMGTNKITNLAPGTADNDAVNVKQLKDTEIHITPGTYTPDSNKKVTLTYENADNKTVTGKTAVIDLSGLATGGTASTEKVQKAADATGDKNIAEVGPKSGDTFGAANATYEVSVSRNAVKDAAREAVTVNNGGTTTGGTYTADTNNPISVTATPDNTNHNTTYAVTFDGNKAAKQIPLTYKANGNGAKTVTLEKGLDFTNGTNTTAEIGNDGVVKYNLNKDVDLSDTGSLTVGDTKVNNDGITIKAPTPAAGTTPTTDVKLTNTGLDNGGNKIVNVAEGTADTDAVNVKQLKDAKTVLADGKNTKKSGTGTAADPYKVNVEGDLTGISSITNGGTNNGKISFGPNKTVTVDGDHSITLNASTGKIGGLQNLTFDPTNFTSGQAATEDQLKSVHDTLKASELHIAPTESNRTGEHIAGAATSNTAAGAAANAYKYDATTKQVVLEYNDGTGANKTGTKAVIDFSALNTGGTTASTWTAKTSAENTTAGSEVGKHAGDTSQVIGNQNSVDFQAGKNMTVKQTNDGNGNTTINYALDKNLDVESVHVGKDGKDGKIGIDGKDGVDGLDGTNRVDIHVEKGAKGVDGTDGHDGVNGHNGKDGMTRIVYEDKGGKQEVATLNDGMKYAGDDAQGTDKTKVIAKKLNETLDIIGGANKADLTTDNIGVNNDGNGKLLVQLSKNLKGINTIKNGNTTITLNNTPSTTTPAVTITGGNLSLGDGTTNNKIVNVAPGTDDTDAVNVKQLKDAKTVLADGKNTKKSGTGTAADPYKVNVEGDLTEITSITNKADASGNNAGKITFSPNQTVTVSGDHNISLNGKTGDITGLTNTTIPTTAGSDFATKGRAATEEQLKIVNDKFNNKINLGADGNTETTKLALDNNGGIKFNIKGDGSGASGANQYISTTASGSDIKVDLTDDAKAKLNKSYDVKSTDKSVTVSSTTTNGVTTFDLKVAPVAGTTSTWDIKSSADTANGGATATGHEVNAKTIANTNSVEMIAGKNLTVKQTSDTNGAKVEFALSDEITVGKDGANGVDGKIGVNGKDGASVVINGKDGSIGLTGPRGATGAPGASATLNVKDGVPGVDGAPGTNLTRIVYTDKNNVEHEVATHDDGMKFAGDDGQANQATNANVIKKHLNNVVDIIGGATKTDLTTNNIGVNNDGNGKLLVQLSKNLNGINTVKNGNTTITLNDAPGGATNTPAVTISGGNLSVDGNKVTNVDDGTDNNDAVNVKQLKAAKTEVKAGENVTVKHTTDGTDNHNIYTVSAVTPAVYTTADGTKVYKIVDPTTGAVTWNTSPDGTGTQVNAGDIITSFETPANGTTKGSTTGGTMIVNNVGSAINGKTGATYLDKLDAAAGDNNTKNAAVNVTDLKNTADALKSNELHIRPTTSGRTGETVNKNTAGTAESYKYDAATKSVTLKYNDGTGAGVTGTEAKIDLSGLADQITSGYTFSTNAKGNLADGTTATATAVGNGKTVSFAAGKNLTVEQNINATTGEHTYTYALSDKITAGKDGVNGKDGSVGVTGKDGSSVVINGADGSIGMTGPKGQDGKDGINGRDGANLSMTSAKGEQVLVNRDPAHNADTDKAERIVYVPKDASGNPIQDANGKNIVREVATMDDGLKFTGNNESTENKHKLGSLVKVKGEGVTEAQANAFTSAAGNIAVVADGTDTLTVKLNKNLAGINKISNGNSSITLNDTPSTTTPAVTISGGNLSMGDGTTNNKIVNVAPGTDDSDAVNYKQLKAAKTEVKAGKNVVVTSDTSAADGHTTYTVNASTPAVYTKPDGTKLVKQPDGTFKDENGNAYTGSVIASFEDGTGATTGGNMIVNNVGSAIKTQTGGDFLTKLDNANTATPNAAVNVSDLKSTADALKANERHIAPTTVATGSTETKGGTANAAGTANVYKYDAASKTVTLTYNDGNGNAVTDTKAVIDLSNLSTGGTGASSWNVKSSANTTDGGAVDANHNANAQNIADGKSVEFQSGKNLVVKQTNDTTNGNATVEFSLSDNITVGKDGANGKDGSVGAKGADGSAVVMNGKDGSIGLNGTNGANGISIKGKDGANGVGIDGKDGVTRIVYTEKVPNPANPGTTKEVTHEVATMDDGLKFTGNNTATENKRKLGSLLKVQGEDVSAADEAAFQSAGGNIAVTANGSDTLTIRLNKNLKGLNSIQLGGNTIQSNGDNITFTTNGGTTKTVATTDQLWTIQANGTDVPAKSGKVNLVAGDHITITPDAANGKMTISATGFGSMDGFNVKTSADANGTHAGDTTENIKNGKTVDMQAGKNLVVTQTNDGNGNTTVNYALNKDVDLGTNGSLKAGDTTINKDGVTIANGPSVTKTGVDAGNKKITNVADGDVNATSKDAVNGSQLKKYTDAAKTTVEAGDTNVQVETDNSAADGHTNYKVSLKPVVEIGDTHKVKIDGHTGDITGLTNVDLTDPTFATKGRAATEEQLNKVLTEAKKKAVEKVQAGTAAAGDTNIAKVAPKAGDTFGTAGATYEVSVSKNDVKDAAKEAVKVTSASPAITVTADTSVAHETTYKVGFDGNQAATQIPLTYKQNGGNTRTVKLSDGLNFIDGTNTKARTAPDGKVTFDVMGDLTGITSISNAAGGPKMTFGGNSINVTGGNLDMGGKKITNIGKGTDPTDAARVGQLTKVTSNNHSVVVTKTTDADGAPVYDLAVTGTPGAPAADPRVDMLGEEIGRVGAQGAALSALKPIQYDPLEPTQIMAGYGNYRGNSAIAMGVAHYKNESTLMHAGVSWAGGSRHMMANAGVTWKVGNRDSEAAVADRYRKGPISSAYAMQQEMAAMKAQNAGLKGEVSDLKAENEQMKAQIAAMMAKLGL